MDIQLAITQLWYVNLNSTNFVLSECVPSVEYFKFSLQSRSCGTAKCQVPSGIPDVNNTIVYVFMQANSSVVPVRVTQYIIYYFLSVLPNKPESHNIIELNGLFFWNFHFIKQNTELKNLLVTSTSCVRSFKFNLE